MIANFKNKRNRSPKKQLLTYIGAFVIFLILGVLVVANWKMYHKRQEYLAQVASLQKQIKEIQDRNNNLNQGITQQDNNQYIEKVAREQLDLQKPGENAVSFVVPKTDQQKADNSKKNIFQRWWDWITGNK